MTPDITDQDEREAIEIVREYLELFDKNSGAHHGYFYIRIHLLRALLHRATRAHD